MTRRLEASGTAAWKAARPEADWSAGFQPAVPLASSWPVSRRDAVRSVVAGTAGLILASCTSTKQDPWSAATRILARIVPPRFPRRDFPAGTDINAAIDACHLAGGGRVVVAEGEHDTGPIRLRSGVELHVPKGATLRFSRNPADYPLVHSRWEGVELMNYSPLIYAFECENVAVTGEGTLDGQADDEHWWPWKGVTTGKRADVTKNNEGPAPQLADRNRLFQQAEDGVPVAERVYGQGHFLRPSFFEPYRCKNVLIEGVTFTNAPFWVMHPTLCTNVTVRKVKVVSHGPNNDGCDPESCRGVLIEDCLFDTGDDCIALKSGRNADGRRLNVPVEDVVIRRCEMKDGHGGITIGSEISGGARNVFAENCRLDSPDLERALRFKTNTLRGGIIENVYVRDIEIGTVNLAPIEIDLRYEPRDSGRFIPQVRSVLVERMRSKQSKHGLYIRGLEHAPMHNIVVRDSVFRGVAQGNVIEGAVDLTLERVTIEAAPPKEKK